MYISLENNLSLYTLINRRYINVSEKDVPFSYMKYFINEYYHPSYYWRETVYICTEIRSLSLYTI